MRLVRTLGEPDALAEDERQGEARGTGVDVDRGPTGEVDDAPGGEHARGQVEDPRGDREVDDRDPDAGEDHPRAELRTVGDRAGDERDRDDREGRLEADEGHRRVGRVDLRRDRLLERLAEADLVPVDAEEADDARDVRAGAVVGEGDRVAVEHPQDADEGDRPEGHHHHADDGLGLHQTAVEEGQAGCHEQHQRRHDQHECRVALIKHLFTSRECRRLSVPPRVLMSLARRGFTREHELFRGCNAVGRSVNVVFRGAGNPPDGRRVAAPPRASRPVGRRPRQPTVASVSRLRATARPRATRRAGTSSGTRRRASPAGTPGPAACRTRRSGPARRTAGRRARPTAARRSGR